MVHSTLSPLERPDWDAQIAALPEATVFHSSGWARTLVDAYGYRPRYQTVFSGDRMSAVWPLMGVTSWLTGRRGISLPFTDVCEPLGADEELRHLCAAGKTLAIAQRWKSLEWRGGRRFLADAPASTTFHVHRLDLTQGIDRLLAGLESGTRRAVRKAEQGGLGIDITRDKEGLDVFYGLLALTRRKHGVPPQPYRFFAALHRHLISCGCGDVILARHEGAPIAGILCLRFGRHVIYKYGGSDERYQQLRANNLVMWRAIQHYIQAGCSTFDFGRTSLANEGLRRFKLGWGASESAAGYTKWDARQQRYVTAPDRSSGSHSRVFQNLPLSVSRWIGTLLYRHIP